MVDTKIMIGVPTGIDARVPEFYDCLQMLEKPDGTIQCCPHGQSPAHNRNIIIQQALSYNCSHILFIDDDMHFPASSLQRLLIHEKDIVGGYYLMRNHPHKPLLFDKFLPDGSARFYFPSDSENQLCQVVATGLGFCLIKTEVFKIMDAPWITLGELQRDQWCDDISFFHRLPDGLKVYVDLGLCIGHYTKLLVTPQNHKEQWFVKYSTGSPEEIMFPSIKQAVPAMS